MKIDGINGKYFTRLLVDCSGTESYIVEKYNLVKLPIYINCFAYIGEFDKVENNNYYCFFRNKDGNHYSSFGFTKIAPKRAQLQYFEYSNIKPNLDKYKNEMKKAQKDFNIPKHKKTDVFKK